MLDIDVHYDTDHLVFFEVTSGEVIDTYEPDEPLLFIEIIAEACAQAHTVEDAQARIVEMLGRLTSAAWN